LVTDENMNTTNYPVGDFLTRVKNAILANKKTVVLKNTKLISSVAEAMQRLGYFSNVKVEKDKIEVAMSRKSKDFVITDIKLISKPGLRVYKSVEDLEKHKKPSTLLISTPKGILSLKEAIGKRVGGEVLAEIY
jgi:small subunit ribosomal protein S8